MFISVSREAWNTLLFYVCASLFFAVFGGIYELFSHEVYSGYMVYAFMIPLVFGVIPGLSACRRQAEFPSAAVLQMYGGGIMSLTLGCVIRGVLDIYGTTNGKILFYPVCGFCMILASFAMYLFEKRKSV